MTEPSFLSAEQIAGHRDASAVALHFLTGDTGGAVDLIAGKSEQERGGILVALAQQLGAYLVTLYGQDGAQTHLRQGIEQLMREELAAMVRQSGDPGGWGRG